MDKSTILSVLRTKLSVIRTLLTYVILTILCMLAGFILIRLDNGLVKAEAVTMFVLSGVFFAIGVCVYYLTICRLKKVIGGDTVSVKTEDGSQKIKINTNI